MVHVRNFWSGFDLIFVSIRKIEILIVFHALNVEHIKSPRFIDKILFLVNELKCVCFGFYVFFLLLVLGWIYIFFLKNEQHQIMGKKENTSNNNQNKLNFNYDCCINESKFPRKIYVHLFVLLIFCIYILFRLILSHSFFVIASLDSFRVLSIIYYLFWCSAIAIAIVPVVVVVRFSC